MELYKTIDKTLNGIAIAGLAGWLGLTTVGGVWLGGDIRRIEYKNKKIEVLESLPSINPSYPFRPSESISKDDKKRGIKKKKILEELEMRLQDNKGKLLQFEKLILEEELEKLQQKYKPWGSLEDILYRSIGGFFGWGAGLGTFYLLFPRSYLEYFDENYKRKKRLHDTCLKHTISEIDRDLEKVENLKKDLSNEKARKELRQLYDSSRWCSVRYYAGKALSIDNDLLLNQTKKWLNELKQKATAVPLLSTVDYDDTYGGRRHPTPPLAFDLERCCPHDSWGAIKLVGDLEVLSEIVDNRRIRRYATYLINREINKRWPY